MTGAREPEAHAQRADPAARAGQDAAIAWPAYWLRIAALGVGSRGGELRVADGRISFAMAEGILFDAPVSDLRDVRFPRWQGGKVFKLKVDGRRFRIALNRSSSTIRYGGGTEYADLDAIGPGDLVARRRGEELRRLLGVASAS